MIADNTFSFHTGKALWNHRKELVKVQSRLVDLSHAVGRISDSGLSQYGQLFTSVLAFKPSVIIELGRGYGNSTAVLTEAANHLSGTRKVISICLSNTWQEETANKVSKIVETSWFDKLDVRIENILNIAPKNLIQKNDRIFFLWDAHGYDIADYIFSRFLPSVQSNLNIFFVHDILDLRYNPSLRNYSDVGIWKGYLGDETHGTSLIIDSMASVFEEIISIHDFTRRNEIDVHAVEHEVRQEVFQNISRTKTLSSLLGNAIANPSSSFHWFSLNERRTKQKPFFPPYKTIKSKHELSRNLSYQPLVSIVTPCFNSASYIKSCIESILLQDYPRVEHIIQDGGSTDGTTEIIKEYAKKYPKRIRWISEKDLGQSDGLNKALKRIKGEIFLVLNADDMLLPQACSWGVQQMKKHDDCGCVYGDEYIINEFGAVVDFFVGKHPYSYDRLFCVELVPPAQAAFVRTSMMKNVGLFADILLSTCPDFEMWVRLGAKYPMAHEFGPICMYRHHNESEGRRPEMIEEMVYAKKNVIDRALLDSKTSNHIKQLQKRAYAGLYHWAAISANSIGAYRVAIPYLVRSFWYKPEFHKALRIYRLISKHTIRYLSKKIVESISHKRNHFV